MNILVISDSFLPEKISAGKHMSDLVKRLVELGHNCTLVATQATVEIGSSKLNYDLFSINNPLKRSKKLYLRAASEIILPILLGIKLLFSRKKYDLAITYSPSIFWVLLLIIIGQKKYGKNFLIVRDLFPLWLSRMNILSQNGVVFLILNRVAKIKFAKADKIFVQSKSDLKTLKDFYGVDCSKLDVLENWYQVVESEHKFDELNDITSLHDILLLGNFGVAQNQKFLRSMVARSLKNNSNFRFIYVGLKNTDLKFQQKSLNKFEKMGKVIFMAGLTHEQAVCLARRCKLGIVSLAPSNTPGNIPGKFCAYTMAGLPTFCVAPENFEVAKTISKNALGMLGSCLDEHLCFEQLSEAVTIQFDRKKIEDYGIKNFSVDRTIEKLIGDFEYV